MDEQLERLLSERLDEGLTDARRAEVRRAMSAGVEAEQTAAAYERLAHMLAAWRCPPQSVDWRAAARDISQCVEDHEGDTHADRGDDADRLVRQWAGSLPEVDWRALSSRISSAVRAEAAGQRARANRGAARSWIGTIGAPLAAAAAIALAAIWWTPSDSMTTTTGGAEAIVVVELDTPSSAGTIAFGFVSTPFDEPEPEFIPHGRAMAYATHPEDLDGMADDGYY